MNPQIGSFTRAASAALLALASLLCSPDVAATQWFVQSGGSQVAFSPQFLTIQAGDTVTFLNLGGYHNVVADDGSFRCAHGCDGDGEGGSGNPTSDLWFATVAFPAPGTVGYFCEPHGSPGSGMFGTIIVQAPATPATPAPIGGLALDALLGAVLAVLAAWGLRRKRARHPPVGT
ncbi:MAG TPA: plastocyanin/azurin family copper-binding protein [Rudaea sp.]|nr:plastocyanin/azurin family copper-binding protein [Rudaea sp.]